MYYQDYEDYMRKVLGYPIESQNTYRMDCYEDTQNTMMLYQNTKELEDCYPEVYKVINPIVCNICDKCNNPITRDIVEDMVEEVYKRVENNNEIAIKINIDNRINEPLKRIQEIENRQRRPNNPFLRDLIKILILNRLLGSNLPLRPPYPRRPNYIPY